MSISFSRKGALLVAIFLLLAVLPLLVAMVEPPPPRPFWIEFGVGIGFVALAMMGIQFFLTARFPSLSRRFGQDTLLQFHRQSGIIAAALVLLHPAILILAHPPFAAYFDPRVNFLRTASLVFALAALAGVILLSVYRVRLAIKYEWWRLTHAVLAAGVLFVGMVHSIRVGHYTTGFKIAFMVLMTAVPLGLLVHMRIVRPLFLRSRPYRVASIRLERPRVWTVALEPVGEHRLKFRAGQFVWASFGASPLSLSQNPFTIASSDQHPEQIELTIKELGDFTNTISDLPLDSLAFLDGPAGSFGLPDDALGAVFIAGGIGVTPAMSIIRTMRDRPGGRDPRAFMLFYSNDTLEKAAFRRELQGLESQLPLRVIHVPENPPEDWSGPSGYLNKSILQEHLSDEQIAQHHFMICGPPAMMDAIELALLELGVGRNRIRSERFNIV
jgi:predicted ferric reductase